jgi:hypothetical protein
MPGRIALAIVAPRPPLASRLGQSRWEWAVLGVRYDIHQAQQATYACTYRQLQAHMLESCTAALTGGSRACTAALCTGSNAASAGWPAGACMMTTASTEQPRCVVGVLAWLLLRTAYHRERQVQRHGQGTNRDSTCDCPDEIQYHVDPKCSYTVCVVVCFTDCCGASAAGRRGGRGAGACPLSHAACTAATPRDNGRAITGA